MQVTEHPVIRENVRFLTNGCGVTPIPIRPRKIKYKYNVFYRIRKYKTKLELIKERWNCA